MSDPQPQPSFPEQHDNLAQAIASISGGVNLESDQTTIGGDVVGRDKLVSTTTYQIEHATFAAPVPDVAGQGLSPLPDLMQRSAEVRHAVVAFPTVFGAAHQQLGVVADDGLVGVRL